MDLFNIRKQINMGIPLSSLKIKVTFYVRVSTDHLEQLNSLNNQIDFFKKMIRDNPNWEYIDGYIDEGISGIVDYKRDSFMKMISDAKKNKFDLVLTKEISRFSRNTLDSIKYTRKLLSYGVGVLFLNDNINTILSDSELRLTIMASMAQDEVRRLSERVKFGMQEAIKKGHILGNDKLYGYKKDKISSNLVVIKEEAKIIKRIYSMYVIDNYSLTKICNILNKENIKTKYYKKWSVATISRIIKNPKYKGYYCANKTEVTDYITKTIKKKDISNWVMYKDYNKVPLIIKENIWNKANIKINNNKKIVKNKYLFSNKIYCLNDNYVFHRRIQCKNKEVSWLCSNYLNNGKKSCDSANVRESELDKIIDDLLNTIYFDTTKINCILFTIYSKYINNIEEYTSELEKLINKKKRLIELNLDGLITKKEFDEYSKDINDKIKIINNRINNKNNIDINKIIKYVIDNNIKNYFIDKLINKILVKNNNNDIEIYLYIKYKYNNFTKNYKFKRGYNTKSTKRYTINYKVYYCFI